MKEGLQSLTPDAFSLIAEHLDGRDGAALRSMCHALKRLVDRNQNMTLKIRLHLIALTEIEDIQRVVSPNPLVKLSSADANMWLQNILWYIYRINAISVRVTNLDTLLRGISRGEGDRFYRDTVTNDIIFCNNHYGSHLRHCLQLNGFDPTTYTYYHCSPSEHVVEQIERINECLPGFIKNYKLIDFPFQSEGRHRLAKDDCGLHRGTCECVTFNSFGIEGVRSIYKNLERMQNAEPNRGFMYGRGKKRGSACLDEPPLHPIANLKTTQQHGRILLETESKERVGRKFLKHHKSRHG